MGVTPPTPLSPGKLRLLPTPPAPHTAPPLSPKALVASLQVMERSVAFLWSLSLPLFSLSPFPLSFSHTVLSFSLFLKRVLKADMQIRLTRIGDTHEVVIVDKLPFSIGRGRTSSYRIGEIKISSK